MPQTLYIIDGHSQIYRAYYAPFRPLSSPTGEPTRATYVFCSMLLKFIADRKPPYLAMAVDGPTARLERRQVYGEYKATRAAMPDDLPAQIERILQIVKAMGIPILQVVGHEADDIIATAAHRFASEQMDVVAVSRDKDLDQIVGPHVTLYDPMMDQTLDAAAIEAQKGYPPDKAIEVQSLMGDSIDNIPGIPGIGPKTAAKLIVKYGSAQAVLEHADEQTPKLRENLLKHAANIDLARKLVTLNRDVPIELSLETMRLEGIAQGPVRAIFAELGFNRLLEQLDSLGAAQDKQAGSGQTAPTPSTQAGPAVAGPGAVVGQHGRKLRGRGTQTGGRSTQSEGPGKTPAPLGQLGLFAAPEAPTPSAAPASAPATASPIVPAAEDDGLTTAKDFKYSCIDTIEALESVAKELTNVPRLAVDTETTGSQPMWCELVGISLAWKSGEGVYLPIKGPPGDRLLPLDEVKRILGPMLANPRIEKIGQNLKYDLITLTNAGFHVAGKFFDTMVAAHVLDSTRMSYAMGALSAEFLGHRCIPIEHLIGRGKNQITMDRVPTAVVAVYSGEDADVTFRLAEVFRRKLAEDGLTGLFENLEMPLLPVLVDMERAGIRVDPKALKRMEEQLGIQAQKLRERIILAAGRDFNPDSPKQLAVVLFEDLKLPIIKSGKTGASTDSDVLEQLAVAHELPGLVLDYRKLTKLIGTYLTSLAECIHPRTGRIHTSFHQAGTATGRLSSSDPNLQNIPVRTEEGREIRSAFVADAGCLLLSADYSQVELRVLAHLCEDPTLIAAFGADQDIHRIVAAEVFGVPVDQVSADQRARAKTVNFGIIYGQTAFGLSVNLRIGRKEAGEFIARYRQRFPRIDEFLQACIRAAKAQGYVETIFGRRRRIPEISSPNPQRRAMAERLAINSVVQGSAADLIKQAMVNIAARIQRENRPGRMLLQIHDELLFEIPQDAVESEREMVIQEMSGAIQLRVPLKVEAGVGPTWKEAK